jgi:hypothetical protein
MSVARAKDGALSVFHPGWVLSGIGVWLGIQLLAWLLNIGILSGLLGYLLSYFLMGILIGWASPGSTIIEPGVAAFVVAAVWFVLDHLFLSVLGFGIALAAGYGALGLVLGVAGGWVGEAL